VGNLFKHKATEKVKTDLLIFITPTLVKGSGNESTRLLDGTGESERAATAASSAAPSESASTAH
jgi:type II secretory pathway component GspD/PulD (secretin)